MTEAMKTTKRSRKGTPAAPGAKLTDSKQKDSPTAPPEAGSAIQAAHAETARALPQEPEMRNETVLRAYQRRWANDPARFALAVKSAQIGFSTATAAWAVDRCMRMPKRTIVFLSRSERQSKELAEKAKMWLDGYKGAIAAFFPDESFEGTSVKQHEIRFPNQSRIIVLAANPDTARGYTGDVVLDEFAFHNDAQSIFTAVYRQASLGYSMRVLSTPNGPQGKFYETARDLELDSGQRPPRQPVEGKAWSGHWVDINLAVEEGCPLDVELVKAGCDENTWLQEYCCQFVSEGSQWISPELYGRSTSPEASLDLHVASLGPDMLYAGWDIARSHDLSVIWLCELVGDVTWTRGVVQMRNTPTPDQVREARSLMPYIRRMEIDQGGMGLAISEALAREFPDKIEGLQFTSAKKETMAVYAKRRMEEGKIRLPENDHIRQSFRSVQKSVNALGQTRYDADHDSRYGHADHWWAFCLAEMAAQQPAYHLAEVGGVVGATIAGGIERKEL
jgi:phage FluMu gp28-like protein